jgi:tetratricopeptide (TPR) repeat protein
LGHGTALVVFLAALGLIAYETAKRPSGGHGSSMTFGQSVAITISKPAVAIPVASLLVLGIANVLRRLWLEWLVIKPGRIFVHELSASPDLCDVDVARLTTAFRRRLMLMRLSAPTPVPGTAPSQDFLSVLDGEHLDAKNVLASAVSILRAAIPTTAYEVSLTLTQEPAAPPAKARCGVTAQVSRLPNEGIPVDTAWAHSWDEAITRAADMVTAAILPRTILSKRQPWSGWRRYPMPSVVVHHYETAQELTAQRRYDEALSHYFKALALDPKNVDLRLHKGFVEEKLGLYVDAVATYAAARRVADDTSKRLYDRRARVNRKAAGNTARYRLAVLLSGVKFSHQWRKPDDEHTARDAQRLLLRSRVRPELQHLVKQHKLMPAHEQDLIALLDEFRSGPNDDDDPRYYELRVLFANLARCELLDVRRKLRRRGAHRSSLTRSSVNLTVKWLDLRLLYLRHRSKELISGTPSTPPVACDLRPEAMLPSSPRAFQTWTEEYNAACLFALPLLLEAFWKDDALATRRGELATRAVGHLERAMSSTVSWVAAQRRDWVLSEDPDLDGLRRSPEFKHFEAIYFPSPSKTPLRPRGIHKWEQSRYTNELLAQTARRWETVWHLRRDALRAAADPHVWIEWSVDEADAWRLVERLSHDYRHWLVRHELIEKTNEWSAKYGFEPLAIEVPRFVSENGADLNQIEKDVEADIEHSNDRLGSLGRQLGMISGNHSRQPSQLERLQIELQNRDFWHRAAPKLYLPSVCDVHAAMWQRLHEWLEEKPNDKRWTARSAFTCAVQQVARLSGTSHGLWRVAVVDRRLRRLASGSHREAAQPATGRTLLNA